MNKRERQTLLKIKTIENFCQTYGCKFEEAAKLYADVHRLGTGCEKECELSNTNTPRAQRAAAEYEKRNDARIKKIDEAAKKYGLKINFYGIYPRLEDEHQREAICVEWY